MVRKLLNWTNLRKAIIMTLVENGEMSRSELKKKLSIPMTTLYCNLTVLEIGGYVKFETKSLFVRKGRPTTYWSVVEK